MFESLYDSSLLAGLSPHLVSDQSEEEEANDPEMRERESPPGLTDQRRRSQLLANQEAEQQEAVCWGESSFSLSEWGDTLLVGEHFLERQCLLRCEERSVKEHSSRHDKDLQLSGEQQASEPERAAASTTPSKADHGRSGRGGDTGVTHEPQMQTTEGVCSKMVLFKCPRVQNAPSSTFSCSPGLQEIFDCWPSMSEQPCLHAASSRPANTAQALDLPQASTGATRERGTELGAAAGGSSREEQLSGQEPEDAPGRPGSASDLIPPTQERPPVTPRVKLTTSSVQSPLQQSTPSAPLPPKPAVSKKAPQSQSGQREDLSEQADFTSRRDQKHQQLKAFPLPNPGSSANLKQQNDQSVGHRPELPSHVESPVADKGVTPQASQDASLCSSGSFTIIDVASDRCLFETFINEWKTKERYSLALACEQREPQQQPGGEIGRKPKKGSLIKRSKMTLRSARVF